MIISNVCISYHFQVIIAGELDYWDVDVQNEIENLTKTFENSTFISSPLYTESWVRSFVNYVNRNQEELNVTIDTRETFLQTLNDVRIENFRIIYIYVT